MDSSQEQTEPAGSEAADTAAESEPDSGPEKPTEDPSILDEARLAHVLESLIFVSDQPISAARLARITKTNLALVRQTLGSLVEQYATRGVELTELSTGFQFRSSAENAAFARELIRQRPVRLTRAQLEALSIVAYRQPVTRPELEDIRGVDSGSALKVLLERGLLRILGRKEEPGRPLLYGTSPQFLALFGLKHLRDLPTLREFSELSEESRALFERRMGEPFEQDGLRDASGDAHPAVDQIDGDTELEGDDVVGAEGDSKTAATEDPRELDEVDAVAVHAEEAEDGCGEAGDDREPSNSSEGDAWNGEDDDEDEDEDDWDDDEGDEDDED